VGQVDAAAIVPARFGVTGLTDVLAAIGVD
jgi:hypothetical protein